MTPTIGDVIAGYKLEEHLGTGGTAVVYSCLRKEAQYAIKIYKKGFLDALDDSERDEVQERIERQLDLKDHDSPYLVKVIDGGTCAKTKSIFLVMECLGKLNLEHARRKFPKERIGPVIAQIAEAAEYLENCDIVHRDIKSSNVWISADKLSIKLLDLGVLRPVSSELTDDSRKRPFIATTRYSPYEFLMRADPEDKDELKVWYRAVTFYQIGAILYELLRGKKLLHEKTNAAELIDAIKQGVPTLSAEDGPSDLVRLANRALTKSWKSRAKLTWDDFRWPRLRRKPTVLMLAAGGTILSETDPETFEVRLVRDEAELRELRISIQQRIRHDYEQLYQHGEVMPFDFQWHSLPSEEPIHSENADIGHWDRLTKTIRDLVNAYCVAPFSKTSPKWRKIAKPFRRPGETAADFFRRARETYVVGVIVLHGTDTLGYTAAALSFSLKHLPCPVVLTASNRPPNLERPEERRLFSSESDAWRNLRRCVQFLQAYGHRCTDVFVCFGDTVHHAANLRKEPILQVPGPVDAVATGNRYLSEPFCFRNMGAMNQYMFRLIDGVYCNTFYPTRAYEYMHLVQDSEAINTHEHLRKLQVAQVPAREAGSCEFCEGVCLLAVSPGMSHFTVPKVISGNTVVRLKAVIIEGYESGTFPTLPGHTFSALLASLVQAGVPLVLIARNGLVPTRERYATFPVGDDRIKMIRLFGVTAETALPLVSLSAHGMAPTKWSPGRMEGLRLYDHRRRLLEASIVRFQKQRPNIVNCVLANVIDEREQRDLRTEERSISAAEKLRKTYQLFGAAIDPSLKPADGTITYEEYKAGGDLDFPKYTCMVRPHFLWMLLECVQAFEQLGAGAETFAILSDLGFTWGRQEFERRWTKGTSGKHFRELMDDERSEYLGELDEVVNKTCFVLFVRAIAEISVHEHVRCERPSRGVGYDAARLEFSVFIVRQEALLRQDSLYAVEQIRASDFEWFEQLRRGVAYTKAVDDHVRGLENWYRNRKHQAWSFQLSPLDWFLVGAFKGLMLEAIRHLRFDGWSWSCRGDDARSIQLLRSSIEIEVTQADSKRAVLSFRYTERDVLAEIT